MTYSSYKSKNTFKALISVSPNGAIIFCSYLFTGNTSDKEAVIRSGVLKTLQADNMILADKVFLIHDILPPGVTVNLPAFLPSGWHSSPGNKLFTAEQYSKHTFTLNVLFSASKTLTCWIASSSSVRGNTGRRQLRIKLQKFDGTDHGNPGGYTFRIVHHIMAGQNVINWHSLREHLVEMLLRFYGIQIEKL